MKVKSIGVEFGVSIATGQSSWVKASAKMEIELDNPSDKTDESFEGAWNRVTYEVNKQVQTFGVEVTKKS